MKRWTYFFIRCVNIFKFWYVFLNLCFTFFGRYLFNKDFLLIIIIIITIIREFIICTIIATNFISFIYNVTIIVIIATITLILVDITIIWIVLNFTMTKLNTRPIFFFFSLMLFSLSRWKYHYFKGMFFCLRITLNRSVLRILSPMKFMNTYDGAFLQK